MCPVVPAEEADAPYQAPGSGAEETEAEDPAGDTEGVDVTPCQPDVPAGKCNMYEPL